MLKSSFPDENTSRRLAWRNIFFPFYNRGFGLITAIGYFMTSWTVMADIGHVGWHDFDTAFAVAARNGLIQAGACFWILLLLAGFVAFTYAKSKLYQWIGGLTHGAVHLLAIFFIG